MDRLAYVVLPAWYGPQDNPPLPAVISPHGRNANGRSNAKYFGNLPAVGAFAVISPDGMGRRLGLECTPTRVRSTISPACPNWPRTALPWLRIDRRRIYALGSSMGGQETLMLVARRPRRLAGAVAMDSVTDLVRRYGQLPHGRCDESCLARWGRPYGRCPPERRCDVRWAVTPGRTQPPTRPGARLRTRVGSRSPRAPAPILVDETDAIVVDQAHQWPRSSTS